MKSAYLHIVFILLIGLNCQSQSIRKSYSEMTPDEKTNLVNAFYQLRTGPDLINNLADFHNQFFSFDGTSDPTRLDLHFNLPDEPERDIFFAWHRRQMFEVEQAMQDINPTISMPYWDSSEDQSLNSPLWNEDFMGQFNTDWSLNRNLGGFGNLPTPGLVVSTQSITDFLEYSNTFERGEVHAGAHRWVGGFMPTGRSPRDPIFYLHHTNVDRLWAEWQEVHEGSSFIIDSMIRYDGTYVFNGETLPLVNPNDIIYTRALGVFYANDGLAALNNYSVSNSFNDVEYFYYQYLIELENDFLVPINTNSIVESVQEINLLPGFEAVIGSSFEARIDNINPSKSIGKNEQFIVRNQIPFEFSQEINTNVYDNINLNDGNKIKIYPNPFTSLLNISFDQKQELTIIEIYDVIGLKIRTENYQNIERLLITDLDNLAGGIYFIQISDKYGNVLETKKVVKN